MARLKVLNWYRLNDRGNEFIGQYMGREQGFECIVCGKGGNARCFNIWYSRIGKEMGEVETDYNNADYETWGFGNEHIPEIIEDLGTRDHVIIGE